MKKTILSLTTASFLIVAACSSGNDEKTSDSNSNTNNEINTEQTTTTESNEIASSTSIEVPAEINALLEKNTCLSCHEANEKVVGPAYKEVAKRNYTNEQIVELIYKPKPSNWPDYPSPMVGLPNVPKAEALKIAEWINSLK